MYTLGWDQVRTNDLFEVRITDSSLWSIEMNLDCWLTVPALSKTSVCLLKSVVYKTFSLF